MSWMCITVLLLLCNAVPVAPADGAQDAARFYDKYHSKRGSNQCAACGHGIAAVRLFKEARSILDAGAGNCKFVRELLAGGYDVRGIELSGLVLQRDCQDLLANGTVREGSLHQLPFSDNQFDVVTSWEVLEHVPMKLTPVIIKELIRVSKGLLLMTISLRLSIKDHEDHPSTHINVHPHAWWDGQFAAQGCVPMEDMLGKLFMVSRHERKRLHKLLMPQLKQRGPLYSNVQDGVGEPWYFAYSCEKR
mmetsp:Transcript_28526/g.80482  ORF Transcript_28526/g.80482 Transcript_28526/m.80482 type:complete len:248 (+) Transcript_28526:79-822(+)